jgi:DNA-binding transcriptional MocR family regulator
MNRNQKTMMKPWTPDLSAATGPKYLTIAEALSRDIEAGVLTAGDRLPPQRALADALGLDLTTITRAYGEAQRLGLIEGNGRKGSFVRARATSVAVAVSGEAGDTGMNAPPDGFGGTLAAAFRDGATAMLAADIAALPFQYQRSGGAPFVRRAGADLLMSRGVPCSEDSVLVAAGGQNALHAIFSAEFKTGDRIAVCAHAYPGLLSLARRFGVALLAIASDHEGMDPAALDEAASDGGLKGVYLVPTNDNPTTATMPLDRREAVAKVIERHQLVLIEDDAYGLLPAEPIAPIAALAPANTWHIASVSKILTPGLRVAWLRAPDVAGAWRLAADMHETAIMAPPLNAAVVAEWVRTGTFQRLVDEIRREARSRQNLARQCLTEASFHAHECGYHLWIEIPADIDPGQVSDALRQHGMSAIPSDAFAVDRKAPNATMLRVSIGGILSRERLHRGLLLLSALISPQAPRKVGLI